MTKSQIFKLAHTVAKNTFKKYGYNFNSYREAFVYGLKTAYAQANPEAAIIKEIKDNQDKIIIRDAASEDCVGLYFIKLEDDKIKIEVNLFNNTVSVSKAYGRQEIQMPLAKISQFLPL